MRLISRSFILATDQTSLLATTLQAHTDLRRQKIHFYRATRPHENVWQTLQAYNCKDYREAIDGIGLCRQALCEDRSQRPMVRVSQCVSSQRSKWVANKRCIQLLGDAG